MMQTVVMKVAAILKNVRELTPLSPGVVVVASGLGGVVVSPDGAVVDFVTCSVVTSLSSPPVTLSTQA